MMLSLINEYGLSHVCGSPEFVDIGKAAVDDDFSFTFNFPYLDILLRNNGWPIRNGQCYFPTEFNLEFYLRGTKTQKLKFENLYEYLLSLSYNGPGLIQSDTYICKY